MEAAAMQIAPFSSEAQCAACGGVGWVQVFELHSRIVTARWAFVQRRRLRDGGEAERIREILQDNQTIVESVGRCRCAGVLAAGSRRRSRSAARL